MATIEERLARLEENATNHIPSQIRAVHARVGEVKSDLATAIKDIRADVTLVRNMLWGIAAAVLTTLVSSFLR